MHRIAVGTAALAAACFAAPALAHHSHAMFDYQRILEIEGTVKVFHWTNPHAWLHVMAPNEKGEMVEYKMEFGGLSNLMNRGWSPKTVLPGDKVTATMFPSKSGVPTGHFRSIVLPSGKVMGEGAENRAAGQAPPD
jgi:hypothetical protein